MEESHLNAEASVCLTWVLCALPSPPFGAPHLDRMEQLDQLVGIVLCRVRHRASLVLLYCTRLFLLCQYDGQAECPMPLRCLTWEEPHCRCERGRLARPGLPAFGRPRAGGPRSQDQIAPAVAQRGVPPTPCQIAGAFSRPYTVATVGLGSEPPAAQNPGWGG